MGSHCLQWGRKTGRRKTESAEYGKKFQRTRKMQTINSSEPVDLEFLGDPKATREDFDEALYVEKSIISYYENDKKEMRASGLAEIAKVLQTTPNYLLGFADNNDGFADEALGLLRDVKDQSVREILLKQIMALIWKMYCFCPYIDLQYG